MVLPKIFRYDLGERIDLIRVINGLKPADIVIVNTNVVSTTTGEVLEGMNILISGKRIVGIGRYSDLHRYIGSDTLVIDGENNYVVPGFIDPHIHIESSLLTPTGFAKLALKHGTTTVVADPHEIANVLGIKGVEAFIREASSLPLKILVDIPSCVPPTDPSLKLETPGYILSVNEIEKLASMEGTIGLGEVMDFVSVVRGEESVLEKISIANKYSLRVNGHAPLLRDKSLDAYLVAGIYSDHESIEYSEALEKVRKGMFIFIREGSAWRDLEALIDLIKREDFDCKYCCFASDDLNVLDLYEKGHMDRIINEAIELGVDPIKAIQLATINPATWLHLEEHIGVIAPGRLADIVFIKDLNYVEPYIVIANGEIIYYKGELKKEFNNISPPGFVLKTVNIREIDIDDLIVKVNNTNGSVKVNVIEVHPGSTLTKKVVEELKVNDHIVKPDIVRDIIYVNVIERHHGIGSIGHGFIKGLKFRAGAVAQTIAHDTHNLIVAGHNLNDMKTAVDRIRELQGGMVVVDHGKIIAEIPLQYGGLMSIEDPEIVYKKYKGMVEKLRGCYGLDFESFFMTLSLISLPVIPEIRLTDKGLIDVNKGERIPLIIR
ncbi:MAG: adenine deaminase [Desulfurococcales archaeon ex4484_58]|nr:MAG: adenine deaminase [Desulfurococcales archaeon ex4484_58]